MSAEIDRNIAEGEDVSGEEVSDVSQGPEDVDLTQGQTPAQKQADDETRSPEEEGGEDPNPNK